MADEHRGGRGYPPRDSLDGSSYPPPPGDQDDRRSQYPLPPGPSSSIDLPPISSYPPPTPGYPSDPRYSDPRYPQDQRPWATSSPTNPNGYAPPDGRYPLPPVSASADRRQYDDRRAYDRQYDDRRAYDDRRQYSDPYYQSQQGQGRGGPYNESYRYPYPPSTTSYPFADYSRGGSATSPTQAAPPQAQAAPRQRTSIACRYCRKRKIRCSGYAQTPNGKCTNCDKLRIECVFQPVSSNSSTAFVPVSAVPGGVPPGTPLYGAYGQPLPPSTTQQPQTSQPYPPPASDYPPPAHSPTSQYTTYDDRDRDPGRRRTRDEDHARRLPPPNYPVDDDHHRRSPSSNHSTGTPPTAYTQYQQGGYDQGRNEAPHRTSPTVPSPSGPGPLPHSQPSSSSNVMSLDHLIATPETRDRPSGHEIDRNMLGKLNRRS
ncbi:hypothetical protein B0H66DRAFT_528446 [Apodospora peruviana]|uniref:Zn(2)-C6 fungal-type domain-containing protein n=1 Tax=Apodospora peruviana TaxID=516989 RepID=A0AAE0ITZ0_9PEZI|nr:hypothetical protein B0H66DRAFT_528446 [Apodospora peruviana]